MRELIEEAIVRKAKGILRVQRIDAADAKKNADRYEKRTGKSAGLAATTAPATWAMHKQYDPKYCIKHSKYLSTVLWRKLQQGDYDPVPAMQYEIPKPSGSVRKIMAFSIPDAALGNVLHSRLTSRNINLFSSSSFAYRSDKSVFDAILKLRSSLKPPKTYVVQYDFSSFFDTISHGYLNRILFEDRIFNISLAEGVAIRGFLSHRFARFSEFSTGQFERRKVGVPQGNSVSLFLSNIAAHELDLELERQNGAFVRFADDVVAVTYSFADAVKVAERFRDHCRAAGLHVNYQKSPGIALFDGGDGHEVRHYGIDNDDAANLRIDSEIDYLGHRLNKNGIGLPDKSISRIKRKISVTIYRHLFLHRRNGGSFNPNRVGPGFFDWDLVTAINEIRSYVYGGLREYQIERFLEGNVKPPFVRGLMAFFPLSTNLAQLKSLDGWLLSVLRRAQRERARMVADFGIPTPNLNLEQLKSGSWYNYPEVSNDARLPSFVRAWRASRKYYLKYGLSGITPPAYYSMFHY